MLNRKVIPLFATSGVKQPPEFVCDLCHQPAEFKCDDCTNSTKTADLVYIGSGEDFNVEYVL